MIIIPVPCLFDNFSYLIGCEETRNCAVVDPSEYYPVSVAVEASGLNLVSALCTHHHRDHIDGLEDLVADYPDLEIFGCHSDKKRMPLLNSPVNDGDELYVGKVQGKVYYTPGHTTGSCLFHFEHALFTGDTVFGAGCGRLFEGTAEEMFQSIQKIQRTFSLDTEIYPGHDYTLSNLKFAQYLEPQNQAIVNRIKQVENDLAAKRWHSFSLSLELETNPFFRCENKEFCAAMAAGGHLVATTPAALFQVVRQLKDNF